MSGERRYKRMKNLKEHINEAWAGVKIQSIKAEIEAWCDEMEIENYTINSKGHIDVNGDVRLKDVYIKELPYKFDAVNGSFTMDGNKKLTSLKNCPDKVTNYFSCVNCTNLKSLEGAPKEVGGSFWCSSCTSLTSLDGAPEKVGKDFYCSSCTSLTSLEGALKEVGRDFYCRHCKGEFTEEDVKKVCKVKRDIKV